MENCGPMVQPRSHICISKNVRDSDGMSPHTPKWIPTLGVGIPMESSIFRKAFQGSKLIGLKGFLYHWKDFETYMFETGLHAHLSTYNTSYGKKKGHESKCQLDSQPLKIKNHLELCVCRRCATYHWKSFNKGYNFFLNLTLMKGLYKKLWASKVSKVLISEK
jgi:hypothetical protein